MSGMSGEDEEQPASNSAAVHVSRFASRRKVYEHRRMIAIAISIMSTWW